MRGLYTLVLHLKSRKYMGRIIVNLLWLTNDRQNWYMLFFVSHSLLPKYFSAHSTFSFWSTCVKNSIWILKSTLTLNALWPQNVDENDVYFRICIALATYSFLQVTKSFIKMKLQQCQLNKIYLYLVMSFKPLLSFAICKKVLNLRRLMKRERNYMI